MWKCVQIIHLLTRSDVCDLCKVKENTAQTWTMPHHLTCSPLGRGHDKWCTISGPSADSVKNLYHTVSAREPQPALISLTIVWPSPSECEQDPALVLNTTDVHSALK